MRQALAEGDFSLEEVGHLNAHGTATHVNDMVEAAAWHVLLGDELASKVPVTSVKRARWAICLAQQALSKPL